MTDVVFAGAYIALLVAILVVLRSPAAMAVLTAVGIGLSGATLQFMGISGFNVTLPILQWWLGATFALILVAAIASRRRWPQRPNRTSLVLVLGSSAGIALLFVISRLLAPGSPGPLSSVGHLVTLSSAEDNAKWLNAAAELASGVTVDAWASVGGPLLLLLTLAATLIGSVSQVLFGGVNEVAVSAGTPLLGEMLLIVIAPFAMGPVIEGRFRRVPAEKASTVPWPILLLGVSVLVTALILLLNYGHLTLQFTIIVLTLWTTTFISWRRSQASLILSSIAVITAAEVWFPLNLVAVALLLGFLTLGIAGLVSRRRLAASGALVASALVLSVLMWDFLRSSISYSLGLDGTAAAAGASGAARGIVALAVPSLPLFSQPGGTEVVTAIFGTLTVLSVIGALLLLRSGSDRHYVFRFTPIILLVVYTLLVTLADFWAVGKGPGYATNKLTFAVAIPILAATLPVAMLALDRGERRMTSLRWFALGGVVMLLMLDTFLPRALVQLKPNLWPPTSGDPQPYWWPAEVRATGDQPLASNPIGCVYLPQGAERPSVLTDGQRAYSCTRLLTGLAGQNVPDAGLVQWTIDEWLGNESLWDRYHQYFNQMTPEARQRQVILLDNDSRVVGIESLQTLLDRYPPSTDTDAPS